MHLQAAIATAGIILATAGLGLLFRYGAPFAAREPDGVGINTGESLSPEARRKRDRNDARGWLGFAFSVAGAILQGVATWT